MEELIEKAKKGDKEAFTELVILNKSKLHMISRRFLMREADIEDAIQETMIKAFFKIKTIKHDEIFEYWIESILINECRTINKKKYKREIPTDVEILQKIFIPKSSEDGDLTEIEHFEARNDFKTLIKKLKEEERTILILRFEIGYTTKQISKILNIKEGTIKSKISRAKNKIDKIKKKGGDK